MSRIFKGDETILDLLIPLKDEGTITSLKIVLYTDNPDIATVFTFKNVELKGGIYSMRVKDYSFSELNDGVLNYVASGEINGENFYFERQSNYYVKTPTNYTPAEPCKIIEYTYDVVRDNAYFTAESQGVDGFSGVHVDARSYGNKKFSDGNYCGYNAGKFQGILAGVINDGDGTKDAPYSASQALNIYKWMDKGTTSDEIYVIGAVCKINIAYSEGKDYEWCITTDLDKVSLKVEKSYNDNIIGWYIEDSSNARNYSILIDTYFSEPSICVLKGKMYTDIDGSWNRFEDFVIVETHPTNFPLFYSSELVDTTDTEVYTATPPYPIHAFSKVTIDSSPYGEIKYGEGYDVGYDEGYDAALNIGKKTTLPPSIILSGSTWKTFDMTPYNWGLIKDMRRMFYNCASLTTIIGIENLDTSNVTTMEEMFNGCGLNSIDFVNNWDVSNVTNMNSAFGYLHELTEPVIISNWKFNAKEIDLRNLFYSIENDYIELNNWEFGNAEEIDFANMFYSGEGKHIKMSNFKLSGKVSFTNLFAERDNLEKLEFLGWDVSNVTSMNFYSLFYNNKSLKEFTIDWDPSKLIFGSSTEKLFGGYVTYPAGTFYYNPQYDYSKLISLLPPTWVAVPIE